jgi:hypothetical protein
MIASSRAVLTYCLGLLGGAALFFLSFAAVFNGVWLLLLVFMLCYAGAGALGVRVGGVPPMPLAIILTVPAVPWILWLFPASVPEAGLLRALLWPALVVLMWALAWLGGKLAVPTRIHSRHGPGAA